MIAATILCEYMSSTQVVWVHGKVFDMLSDDTKCWKMFFVETDLLGFWLKLLKIIFAYIGNVHLNLRAGIRIICNYMEKDKEMSKIFITINMRINLTVVLIMYLLHLL